ncbi:MAG: hypothetical protein PHN90_08840 [Methanothrix sp.]|jgi:hypothetical protein|nr:hypothetical protein [Methanothrix sp.]
MAVAPQNGPMAKNAADDLRSKRSQKEIKSFARPWRGLDERRSKNDIYEGGKRDDWSKINIILDNNMLFIYSPHSRG